MTTTTPPKRPRERRGRNTVPKWRVTLNELDYLLDKLVEVEKVSRDMISGAMGWNAAAYAALVSRGLDLKQRIERAKAQQPDEVSGATPEELRRLIRLQLEGWPDEHIEVAFGVYSDRHDGQLMFVGDGHHAEWNTDAERWEPTG